MNKLLSISLVALMTAGLTVGCSGGATKTAHGKKDAGHGHDYRTFHTDGKVDLGKIGDSYTSDLVMYLAGNQFMVMDELIKDFMSKHKSIKTVYVETIPPGQILKKQLLKQGQIDGKDTNINPDLYASVKVNHLKKLNKKGLMDTYITYIHNKLELMVAKGNPKGIKDAKDLSRDDLVQSHPNPLTEGIFKFYGTKMLKDLGTYSKVTGDKKCKSCWAVEGKTWFTSRHHRETPHRIENGKADVGIVWTSEVAHAKAEGRKIDGVALPDSQNQVAKVAYAIGIMKKGKNAKNAMAYLKYLGTADAQNIYSKYAFIKASKDELKVKTF